MNAAQRRKQKRLPKKEAFKAKQQAEKAKKTNVQAPSEKADRPS